MARSFASTEAVEDFYQTVSQHIPENPSLGIDANVGVIGDIHSAPNGPGECRSGLTHSWF
jgi:hypothetical protein